MDLAGAPSGVGGSVGLRKHLEILWPIANIDFDAILKTFSSLKIFSTETVAICNLSCCEDSVKCNILGLDILLGKLHQHRNACISRKRDGILELWRQAYSEDDFFFFFPSLFYFSLVVF